MAPDKIVFRSGWEPDSTYLLLNLRFTGWHRYKATNSIILLYKGSPILSEITSGDLIRWLPKGRQLLRDKRIPREYLNGLVVERTGMSAVIQHLTGIGSFWAQDPPYYAQVQSFQTGSEVDSSVTTLKDWRGWDHLRQIYFLHQGPVVILDRAEGPAHRQAALTWHLNGEATESEPGRLSLIHEENRNEILVIPLDGSLDPHDLRLSRDSEENLTHLAYQPQEGGSFAVLTIILSQDWFGASASIAQSSTGEHLVIEKPNQRIQLKLD